MNTEQQEMPEDSNVQSKTQVLQQPDLSLASSSTEEADSLPKASVASTIVFDQEEEEVEEQTAREKEVKSILKTDRHVADDGYKAVWFKTDVDPEAGETVEVIEDNAADSDDGSDHDLRQNDDEEEDSDKDDHQSGLGGSFASKSPSLPAAEAIVNFSQADTVTEDDSHI